MLSSNCLIVTLDHFIVSHVSEISCFVFSWRMGVDVMVELLIYDLVDT